MSWFVEDAVLQGIAVSTGVLGDALIEILARPWLQCMHGPACPYCLAAANYLGCHSPGCPWPIAARATGIA